MQNCSRRSTPSSNRRINFELQDLLHACTRVCTLTIKQIGNEPVRYPLKRKEVVFVNCPGLPIVWSCLQKAQPKDLTPRARQILVVSSPTERAVCKSGSIFSVAMQPHSPTLLQRVMPKCSIQCALIACGPSAMPTACFSVRDTLASASPSALALSAACSARTCANISGYQISPTST